MSMLIKIIRFIAAFPFAFIMWAIGILIGLTNPAYGTTLQGVSAWLCYTAFWLVGINIDVQ